MNNEFYIEACQRIAAMPDRVAITFEDVRELFQWSHDYVEIDNDFWQYEVLSDFPPEIHQGELPVLLRGCMRLLGGIHARQKAKPTPSKTLRALEKVEAQLRDKYSLLSELEIRLYGDSSNIDSYRNSLVRMKVELMQENPDIAITGETAVLWMGALLIHYGIHTNTGRTNIGHITMRHVSLLTGFKLHLKDSITDLPLAYTVHEL